MTEIKCCKIAAFSILFANFAYAIVALAGSEEEAVEAVVRGLQTDWNRADMAAYLRPYRHDEALRLVFDKSWLAGFDEVERVFRQQYPDEERMGKFTVDSLEVRLLNDDVAVATGTFEHVFPNETIHGAFTHVLQRSPDGIWEIQHEHTSRGEVLTRE